MKIDISVRDKNFNLGWWEKFEEQWLNEFSWKLGLCEKSNEEFMHFNIWPYYVYMSGHPQRLQIPWR